MDLINVTNTQIDDLRLEEKGRAYIEESKAKNTVRAYKKDWEHFEQWCHSHGVSALPASLEVVTKYLIDCADELKVSTMQRRMAAINAAHRMAGLPVISSRLEPLHSVWRGIVRTKGTAQTAKAPVLTEDIQKMINGLTTDKLLDVRDRALLLLGFAGAFRRSELVALNVEDIEFKRNGLVVTIRRSKTDQEGAGRKIAIPNGTHAETCPVRAVRSWIDTAGIQNGAIFRSINRGGNMSTKRLSDKAVALIVKRNVKLAGLDPARYAGHSLRAGLATSAAQAGVEEKKIMDQTRHKSVNMVRRYIREGDMFRGNAAGRVGL